MASGDYQITVDEIKVHLADVILETKVLRREIAKLHRTIAERDKTIGLITERLPSALNEEAAG